MNSSRITRFLAVPFAAAALGAVAACGSTTSAGPQADSTGSTAGTPAGAQTGAQTGAPVLALPGAGTMSVTSDDLAEGQEVGSAQVFAGNGCTGQNRSPQLSWTGAPKDAKSFAITMYDPDAPTGSGFWHWVAYDLDREATSVDSDASAKSKAFAQASNDFGAFGYGGPCPPAGPAHRYVTTVYALDVDALGLPVSASNAFVRFNIMAHTVATGTLTATYAVS